MQDHWLDGLAGSRGVGSSWPAEVTEGGHSLPSKVVGGQPVIVHHSEGQTGKPVSVLFRAHMTIGHRGEKMCQTLRNSNTTFRC